MSDGKLKIELEPGIDRFGSKFWIGKLRGPFTIDCNKDGVCFMIFVSEECNEQLQISNITSPKNNDRK